MVMSPIILFFLSIPSSMILGVHSSNEVVLTLDHSNFSQTITKHDFIVVEFYAPWCGHCKQLAPEYEKAATILSSHDPPVILAKVDANEEKNKDLATEYNINSFPKLKIFRNGGKIVGDYKGSRDADGIVSYLKKQTGPASVEIKSIEDGNTVIDGDKLVIVGVFSELSGEKFDIFLAFANKLRTEYDFAYTLDAKLLPRGDSSVSGPIVRLFKPFDELVVDFEDFNLDALEKFVADESIPTVTVFNNDQKNHPFVIKFFHTPNAKAMLFMDFNSKAFGDFESKYRDIANENKRKGISFLMGDLEASKAALLFYGLKEDDIPCIVINNDKDKYVKRNIEPNQLDSWLKDYKDGNVAPYVKSEPIPEVNNQPVKVVVADNFDDIIFKSEKNVMLEFYAPWCGHCKKLGPILDKVAASFAQDGDVIIAKIDATANDILHEGFEVKSYPTLYFKSATGKLMQYTGKRKKGKIIDFIKKNKDKLTSQNDDTKIKDEL